MPNKKLKILAASDIHGDSTLIKKLALQAEKEDVDLVILCGDIIDANGPEAKNIIKPFKDKNKKVIIIPGNHDSFATTDFLAQHYAVRNLHGHATIYEGIGFFGAGGTSDLSFFPGAISEKDLFKTLKKAHDKLKGIEKKIMVTHMHPAGSISEFSGIAGSLALTKAIKQFKPYLVLHGHIHEAGGMEDKIGNTRVVNVGRKGKIFEI